VAGSVDFVDAPLDTALPDVYRDAAALVMPSVTRVSPNSAEGEGFGIVYAEAGAFGVPSIASTAGGGASELVRDGVTGLCVPPDDDGALAEAMVSLLTDRELRNRLGQAARDRVLTRHTPAAYAAALAGALG
jgi:glycosyltransferase involved in cell wall biosynthesis